MLSQTPVYKYMQRTDSAMTRMGLEASLDLVSQVATITDVFRRTLSDDAKTQDAAQRAARLIDIYTEQSAMMIAIGHLKPPHVQVDPAKILEITQDQPPQIQQLTTTALCTATKVRWMWRHQNRLQQDLKTQRKATRDAQDTIEQLRAENAALRQGTAYGS